jgi:hypothetical protein
MENDSIKKLVINQFYRVLLSFLIIFGLNIPFFVKILFVMLLDSTDNILPNKLQTRELYLGGFLSVNVTTEPNYQPIDKISDLLVYFFLWIYYVNYYPSPNSLKYYISFLFIFRTIGTVLYFTKDNKRGFLVLFPNIFLESLLLITILQYLNLTLQKNKNIYLFFLFFIVIYKFINEILIHPTN